MAEIAHPPLARRVAAITAALILFVAAVASAHDVFPALDGRQHAAADSGAMGQVLQRELASPSLALDRLAERADIQLGAACADTAVGRVCPP